jgi:hypothetical protein
MVNCDPTLGLACLGGAGAKTCTAIQYVGDGMPCGLLSASSFVGCSNGTCYTATGVATGADQGTCKANATDGAGCDTTVGPVCLTPARCVTTGASTSGTCTVPDGHTCG